VWGRPCDATALALPVPGKRRYHCPVCRSIKTLRSPEPVPDDDVRAAALQFVRKVSGYRQPSAANREAFDAAVDAVTASTRHLLEDLAPARGARAS
jgi:hypothetical protein